MQALAQQPVTRRSVLARRAFLTAGGALLAAAAACAPARSGEQQPRAEGPVTIYWDTFRGVGTPWPEQMIKTFQEKNPRVRVELRPIPIPGGQHDAYPKMYAMFAAGDLGDVFAFDPGHWEFYRAIRRKVIRNLDDYIQRDRYDLKQFFDPFIELQRYEGKIWGLPSWGWSGHDGLIFNEVAVQEAGLAMPDHARSDWSMNTIYEYAVKLTKRAGDRYDRYGIAPSFGAIGATIIARAYNSDILTPDGRRANLLDPNTQRAIRWIYDLCQKDKAAALPGGFQGSQDDLFASGKLAIIHGGSLNGLNLERAIKDPGVAKVRAVLFPKRPDGKRPSQLRGGTWNTGTKSKHPDWGWEFIKHIASKEGVLTFNTIGGNLAATRPDVLQDAYFQSPVWQVFKENLLTAIPPIVPANWRGTEYEQTWAQEFATLYLGKVEFDPGIRQLNDAIQRVLDKPAD